MIKGKVSKQKALDLLEKKIKELDSLPPKVSDNDDLSEFITWQTNTTSTIDNIFYDTKYLDFKNINYSLSIWSSGMPDSIYIDTHNDGLKKAKSFLTAYIKEIKDFWEDEIIAIVNQQPKQIIEQPILQKEIKKMKNIFISHITEEKEVAIIIKKLIEEIFPGQTEIFVSSDGESIIAGTKWLDEISKALNQSDLLITLCSEMSIKRPWINFELGAGWTKDIPIIPVCYLGMTKKQLPQPIAMLQAMDLIDANLLKYMFEGIAKNLKLTLPNRLHFESMMDEIIESFGKVKYKELPLKEEIKKAYNILDEDFYGKRDFCINILKLFMNEDKSFTTKEVKNLLSCNEQVAQFYLDKLVEDDFLDIEHVPMSDFIYLLSTKGREYLIKSEIIS